MKTKLQKLLIAIAGLLVSANAFAHDFKSNGIYYNILSSDEQTVEVTFKDSNWDTYLGEIVIPEQVQYNDTTWNVVQISSNAFRYCTGITSITIPKTINGIGSCAFQKCTHLTTVNITNLSEWCNLYIENEDGSPLIHGAELTLNGEVVTDLSSLTSDCVRIGMYAFLNQQSLTEAIIPDCVKNIHTRAFKGCSNLKLLSVGSGVESFAFGVCQGCKKLETLIFKENENSLYVSAYEENNWVQSFKDCPLKVVYLGRGITWYNDNQAPFTHVPTAIINCDTYFSSFSSTNSYTNVTTTSLENIFFGPNVTNLQSYPTQDIKNVYCFASNISKINIKGKGENFYIIDKTNIPEVFSTLNVTFHNLAEISNFESGGEYEYGSSAIPFLTPSITNNVEGMSAEVNLDNLNLNAGFYNSGLPIVFSNDIWSVEINYPLEYTITKAPVTVIANDVKREYGKENPEFTCSYFGFKNNETDSVLITKPTIATTATAESNVGTYPIIASSAEAKNYTFTYERGTLTITQASQAIEWEQTFEDVTVGDQLQLSATATSGLEVKYSVSDESIAEIYTSNGATFLDCLKAGDVTIKVNQSGDDNWAAADRVTKTITIKPKSGIENVAIPETDELSLTILGNDIVVNNAVRSSVEVYSISGAIIYSTQDYNGETISLSNGAYIVKVGNKTRKVVL